MKKFVKLMTETSYDVQLDKTSKNMYIVGIYSSAEIKNQNGRIYSKGILEREVKDISETRLSKKCLWGELEHGPSANINPDRIAILTEHLEWKGNNLYGRSKVLDTPKGNILRTLVEEGSMGISSRGLGTVDEKSKYVNEDYHLITWDAVVNPSNDPSWINGIYEGKQFEVIENSDDSEEEITEKMKKEAIEFHKKKIWQVIEQIEKNL